ncbi:ninein homolog [Planococcus citri]|uniref:ninein homolog n=1 Tax=Planococcus citri TaxID=170843 RepID=UPI0031F888D9
MEEEIDPYEGQLLAVFKSCDNTGNGVLDQNGFIKLCDTLQLEDAHRSQLSSQLCINGKCNIAFNQFRDALLTILSALKSPSDEYPSPIGSIESPEQEISPKFVFGGKKYGRRSRPASTDQDEEKIDRGLSGSGDDIFCSDSGYSNELLMETDYKDKSKDVNESPLSPGEDFEIEAFCQHLGVLEDDKIASHELIPICSSLGIPNSLCEIIRENISKLQVTDNDITYKELFPLIRKLGCFTASSPVVAKNIGLSGPTPFSENEISSVDINATGCISYDTLVYLFENAGISDASTFLNDLGISPQFDVHLSELAIQLQEELMNIQRCMDDSSNPMYTLLNPHLLLLQASVVVSQAQIKWYRSSVEQMQCERDKLRNDLLVANERASLLAQEVDDNHARMENSLQMKLKLLEQKHAEQIKKLTFQWSAEREQLTSQNLKMEKQLEQLLHDETKLRTEVASLKQDYENLEKENRNLLDQLVNAETVRTELEKEIQRLSSLKKKVLELESSNEQAISFLEKMNQLQAENNRLRDKNDELEVELENVTSRQMQNRNLRSKRRGNSPLEGDDNSDTDFAASSTHRMFSKVRKFNTEKDLSVHSETMNSGGLMTQHSESGVEADISTSSSSLDRVGEGLFEGSDKTISVLRNRVCFLENFINKYQLKVPSSGDDIETNGESAKTYDELPLLPEKSADDLEKQCETLQQRLDQVQKEILKILSEKRACTEENCALKIKISELMKRLPVNSSGAEGDKATKADSIHSSLETVKGEWSQVPFDEPKNTTMTEFANLSECAFKVDSSLEKSLREDLDEVSQSSDKNTLSASSAPTQTVDTSCSSMFATVSEEESEMEWKTIGDDKRPIDDGGEEDKQESIQEQSYNKLVDDYNHLKKENKTLKDKCEELESCLDMLRNEYDQCEEYWSSKLDEERKLFEEEQRISDEKFSDLQAKINEYSDMFDCESMSSQMMSKLPPIAENDTLEKEVTDLQEEFQSYKEKMEHENKEKQSEIERLMQIISLYENTTGLKNNDPGIEQSLESLKSDKTYVLEKPSLDLQEVPRVPENTVERCCKENDSKLIELKHRKKQLKKECMKLELEKESLMDQLIKMKSEPRPVYNYAPCSHVIQQRNAEASKNGILLRLRRQEMKNRQLRNVLLQQQKKLNKTMRETLEQHEKELAKYRSALASSQEMWQSLQQTTKKQAEQIAMSDVLVKELYCENSQLMATIHQLEQQHLDCPSPVLL